MNWYSNKRAQSRAFSESYQPPARVSREHDGAEPLSSHPAKVVQQTMASPTSLTEGDVSTLHGTVGNRVVQRMLGDITQRKSGAAKKGHARSQSAPSGLPDGLKMGIESLSGMSMDDVKVHYNSSSPSQVGALAFASGSEIHMGPGSEEHLPHEAWHLVQQRQGRVPRSMSYGGVGINTNASLESEADFMGSKAKSFDPVHARLPSRAESSASASALGQSQASAGPSAAPVRQFYCGAGTVREQPHRNDIFRSRELDDLVENTNSLKHGMAQNFDLAMGHSEQHHAMRVAERTAQWYVIEDDHMVFYHAARADKAQKHLDGKDLTPTMDFNYFSMTPSDWMSAGYLYFSLHPETAQLYAEKMAHGRSNYIMLAFTLPKGTQFTVDPEMEDGKGLRTKATVSGARIYRAWVPEKGKMKPKKARFGSPSS